MKIDSKSLIYRLIVAIFLTFLVVGGAVYLIGSRITKDIIEDYHHLVASSHASETRRLFEAAIVEMTTARLLDNPEVNSVQQQSLLEAVRNSWGQRGVGGVIVGQDGGILLTTFSPELTTRLVSLFAQEYVELVDQGSELFGPVELVHPWEWRVMTVATDRGYDVSGRVVPLLIPLLVIGPLLMVLALLFILQRQVQRPVRALVGSMGREELVAEIGVTEFDQIGEAFNLSLNRIMERTAALAQELKERRRAEEVIRGQEARIRLLLNSTAEGIYGVDQHGVCTFCNPACCRVLGYTEAELLGRNIHSLIHHSYANGAPCPEGQCLVMEAFRTGQETHADHEVFWRADGSSFAVEYWSHPISENSTIMGSVVAFFDISQRKKAESERTRMEESLVAEKNKFEAIIAGMGDGVSIQDLHYTVLYQNEVHKSFIGSHLGESCYRAYEHKEEVCPGCPVALAMADGRVHSVERCVEFADGPRHFEINASPLRDGRGAIVGGIELVRDITARKRAEGQLIQSQKMEGIGHLAGGVAHDFNNVLSVVQGYADLLRLKRPDDGIVKEHVDQIVAAVQRGSTITRQILAFSRKEAMTVRTTDLNELVTALQKMLRRLVREDIDIQLRSAEPPLLVSIDAGQIDQVLINLTTNACHAMPHGGTLTIETRSITMDEAFIKAHGYGVVGPYALITVTDTGVGMPESVRQRIFEPFFTTKEVGKGTGLGLSMVYGIIHKHSGFINVYSEPDHGTVFRIYLPLVAKEDVGQGGVEAAGLEGFQGGNETILVAEDDPALRGWLQTWVSMGGYTVIEAGDGEEAVQKFTAHIDSIQLVMLDGIMPRKNGKEALLAMRALRPELKAMIVSGYAEDIFTQSELLDLKVTFVEKPVEPNRLMRTIRQVLDAS